MGWKTEGQLNTLFREFKGDVRVLLSNIWVKTSRREKKRHLKSKEERKVGECGVWSRT